ncbi:uncharacterized protein L3040_002961 [Drepanopeziza brunnea f. sp. 'multigermtubi']|nr:hypothetical protein L3040_002961 [Drepanopeziza brunnea f. sp. 'multigermtubi']
MTTIGYRTVSRAEAMSINQGHRPTGEWFDGDGPPQLGDGFFYLTNTFPSWKDPEPDDWFCVIKADQDKLQAIGKAWIPEYWDRLIAGQKYEKFHLWSGKEVDIMRYLHFMRIRNRERALRFSWVATGKPWSKIDRIPPLHMLIPTDVIVDDQLGLWAKCFETAEEVEEFSSTIHDLLSWEDILQKINWLGWAEIIGDPEDPPDPFPADFFDTDE